MVELELTDGLAVITIDRPQARNAIAPETMDQLDSALDRLEDPLLRDLALPARAQTPGTPSSGRGPGNLGRGPGSQGRGPGSHGRGPGSQGRGPGSQYGNNS